MKKGAKEIYAWDVWLIYGADAEWTTAQVPPNADFLMHQLPDLVGRDGFPFLRATAFNVEVEKQLESPRPCRARRREVIAINDDSP